MMKFVFVEVEDIVFWPVDDGRDDVPAKRTLTFLTNGMHVTIRFESYILKNLKVKSVKKAAQPDWLTPKLCHAH